jgi:hypothetical protein
MTGAAETPDNDDAGPGRMDSTLRRDCLRLFEACLAQTRSGMPPAPSLLMSREWEAVLLLLCQRLRAEGEGGSAQMPPDEELVTIQLIVAANLGDARDGLVVDLDPADVSEVIDHLRTLCPNPLFHRG